MCCVFEIFVYCRETLQDHCKNLTKAKSKTLKLKMEAALVISLGFAIFLICIVVSVLLTSSIIRSPTREPELELEESMRKNAKMLRNARKKIESRLKRSLWPSCLWSNAGIINAEAELLKKRLVESSQRVFSALRPLVGALAKMAVAMQAAGKALVAEEEMGQISSVIAGMEEQGVLAFTTPHKGPDLREAAKGGVERAIAELNRAGSAGCAQPPYRNFCQYLKALHKRAETELRSHYTVKKHRVLVRDTMPSATVFVPTDNFAWGTGFRGPRYRHSYSYRYISNSNLEMRLANMEYEQEYFEGFLNEIFGALEESFGLLPEEEQKAMLYLMTTRDNELVRIVVSALFPSFSFTWNSSWGRIGVL